MAVKGSYKIPASLDENYLNMEINLKNKEGIGFRPLPVRVILVWLIFILSLFYLEFGDGSIIAAAGPVVQVIFGMAWFLFAVIMTRTDGARQMRLELIPHFMNYLPKASRNVITRSKNSPGVFHGIVGIDNVDDKSGVVTYTDGTYGYWYAVVGSASVLLFPEDRDAILLRVDDFYKKMQTDCQIIFITVKEPQKVVRQQAHLAAQYAASVVHDPDIDKLYKEQFNVLTNFVGKEFKSLHQYMVVKCDTREALSISNNIILSEYENSNLVFKECTPLYKDDIQSVLKAVYSEGSE